MIRFSNSHLSRRTFLAGTAAAAFTTAACRSSFQQSPLAGEAPCWPQVQPPQAPRIDNVIEQLGRTRNDPYSWMKFIPETGVRTLSNLPDMLRNHLQEEGRYAETMLESLEDRTQVFLEAMLARSSSSDAMPPLISGDWLYSTRWPRNAAYPVHVRVAPDGTEEVLVDEAERAEGHAYYRATDFQASPDHRYFAWAEDIIGNDRHRICVLDTRNNSIQTIVPSDAFGYGGLTFSPSSEYLFWIWRDARNRPTRLYRSSTGGGEPSLVYEETDPAIFMQVARTAQDGYVALDLSGPDMSEVRLIAHDAETAPPRVVLERQQGTTYQVFEWQGALFILTNMNGAFDGKIVRLDAESLQPGATLVDHQPGRPIVSVMPFSEGLVRLERMKGLQQLVIMSPTGEDMHVDFRDPAYALSIPGQQGYEADSVRIGYETPKTPVRWFDIDLSTGSRELLTETTLQGFDPANFNVERIEVEAPDGALVPVTILSHRNVTQDGSSPLLLYGYGAYGVSSEPEFSLPATVLVEAGWRYAIAHVRGGAEKGQQWFNDGKRFKKRNSMTDFVACADALAAEGYADPQKIVSYGLSAGGLLVGGAMNISPERWAGVIAKVPFVDMLNTMSDADHPLVPLFRPDWGDPLADPEAYDYIASISPYENVSRSAYPPLLCTAGLKDDRVAYWEPAKLVAEVRVKSTSDDPAILLIDPDAGHQTSADAKSAYTEMARFWAFAERCAADC